MIHIRLPDGATRPLAAASTGADPATSISPGLAKRTVAALADGELADLSTPLADAVNLLKDFSSHDVLRDRGESLGEEDDRSLVTLLTEQIEFANVIILNKCADAGPERVDAARKIIRALNGDAAIIETTHSDVAPDAILGTGRFDFDRVHEHPMCAKELYRFVNHTPETEEYGVTSFVYHARAPFHPARVHKVLNGPLPGVIRAKGHFWIATRPDWAAEFSLAGAMSSVTPLGRWWASVPEERLPQHPDAQAEIARNWVEPWGDRRQEIVFIGVDMDREAICARLNAALMNAGDFTPGDWTQLPDPFPRWGQR